jgi:type IV pilus assembly protein PilA
VFKPLRKSEQGFTLIELLVVILIIGILAAIAIPSFLSQRGRAQDTATKEMLRTAVTTLETFATADSSYDATAEELVDLEPSLATALNLTVSGTERTYDISADSVPGNNGGTFRMERAANGVVTRTCTNLGQGGCRAVPDASGNLW